MTDLLLQVDNELRQKGSTKDMLFSIPVLISYISQIFNLEPGDCILTGTCPAALICFDLHLASSFPQALPRVSDPLHQVRWSQQG
jgi:hypothetical protein